MKRVQGSPLAPPLVQSSAFFAAGDPREAPFVYGRYGNPTWSALEAEQGSMCGAAMLAFPSGMAACAAVLEALVPRGAQLVAPSDCYYNVRTLIAMRGLSCRWAPSTRPQALIRMSVGLEEPERIAGELERALSGL